MQKIRIKKAPKPGDQQDYSLVGRNVSFTNSGEGTSNVKNTMGAVPVEKANIEVEGGETVVGDINNDGFLEQFTFVGKRHSQGGMPVNIPEGSFIFSDTKKLKIKDKELLESVFGLKEKKGGYTPAEIAKKYQINQFVQDLKSEDTDAIQKRSAAEMLKKNTQKLGMLALVQESMKGFPDGIPAIAESVMAGLQGAQIPGMEKGEGVAHEVMEGSQEMKYGGAMRKYPDGGLVNGRPTKGYVMYIGNTPVKVKSADISTTLEYPYRKDYIVLENGERFTQAEFDQMVKGQPVKRTHGSSGDMPDFSSDPVTTYTTQPRIQSRKIQDGSGSNTKLTISTGDKLTYKGQSYEVVNPYGEYSKDYSGSWKNVRDKFDDTHGIITVKDSKGNVTFLEGEDVGDLYNLASDQVVVTPKAYIRSSAPADASNDNVTTKQVQGNPFKIDAISGIPTAQTTKINAAGKGNFQYAKDAAGTWWYYDTNTGGMGKVQNGTSLDALNGKKQPPANNTPPPANDTPAPKTNTAPRPAAGSKPKTAQDALNYFASGGSVLNQYQTAGTVQGGPGGPQQTQPGTLNTTVATQQQAQAAGNQRVDPNKEIFVGDITLEDGTVVKAYYKGSQKYVKDVNGNILASGPRTDTKFEQYGSTNINKILSSSPNVLYTETNFGSFNNQPGFKQSGIYLSSGNQNARQSGDLSPEEWADFQRRHGDWIDKQYPGGGGFAQFQKDLRTGRTTGDKAAGWFQDAVNEKSMAQAGVPYFAPLGQGKKEDNPYYRDSKFGQVTYSVPRFFDAPKPPEQPGDEVAYFCVEYTNGAKDVVSVSHKAGEQPVAPSGSNIKAVSAASKDKGTVEGQCITVSEKPGEKQPVKEGPWWIQDIVNYVGTQTDQVNRYEPVQAKIDTYTPGYDLLDPTRKLAANQEQMARYQSQVENTADGNVGLATVLGATGEGFANAANVLDTTESANIGIVNAAYDKNAAIQNQEIVGNETARVKYVEDMATLNQQYDDALKQKKWREIAAFNNGTSNWFRKKQTENVLFPQVYIDPIFGDVEFTGRGRQVFGDEGTAMAPDVYQNPMYGGKGGVGSGYDPSAITQTSNAAWKKAYDEALPMRGEEGARNHADAVSKMYLQTARQNPTWQQGFQNAYMNGMTMPAAYNATPWDDDPNN
jgi:hypothetical protein